MSKNTISWATNFDNLINCPLGLTIFSKYLKEIYAHENMDFYQNILAFEKLPSLKKFCSIYNEFVLESLINLDSNLVKDFREKKEKLEIEQNEENYDQVLIDKDSLSGQKDHVYKLMKSDCYPRFLKSERYRVLVGKENSDNTKDSSAGKTITSTNGQLTSSKTSPKIRRDRSSTNKNLGSGHSLKEIKNMTNSTFSKFKGRLSLSKNKLPGGFSDKDRYKEKEKDKDKGNKYSTNYDDSDQVVSITRPNNKSDPTYFTKENMKKSYNSSSYSSLRRLAGNFRSNKSSSNILEKELIECKSIIPNVFGLGKNIYLKLQN